MPQCAWNAERALEYPRVASLHVKESWRALDNSEFKVPRMLWSALECPRVMSVF